MTDKIVLGSIATFQNDTSAVAQYNANNALLTLALDNTLSRDGTSPNQMSSSLDMSSNRIINLPAPISTQEPLRLADATTLNGGGIVTVSQLPIGGTTGQLLAKNSNTNFDVLWVTSTAPSLGGTNIWTGSNTFNLGTTFLNTLTITPASGTSNQGLNITQTGPSSSSGPLIYNLVTVFNTASVTSPSSLTNGMLNAEARGFHVEFNDASATTVSAAGTFHNVVNSGTPNGDKCGIIANAYTSKSINGFCLGGDLVAAVDTGGSTPYLVAAQLETGFYGTGTATNRIGCEITNDTSAQATSFDAAIAIDNIGALGGAFQKGISFGSPVSSIAPIASTGDCIYVQQPFTVANFVNAANLTVTGNLFNFPTVTLGNVNNQNASTSFNLQNTNAGTATYCQYSANNGTNTMTVGIGGTGATPAVYQGRAYVTGNGTGLVVGTNSLNPTIFLTNNVEAGRWDGTTTGQLDVGVTGTLAGAVSFRNATSGSITIQPAAGALGSSVLTLPITTGTVLITTAASGLITTATNTLSGDVSLSNTGVYFTGPSCANGTAGTWFASGTVTLTDTAGAATYDVKLWDGTTVIASTVVGTFGAANTNIPVTLSGIITTPAGNIRISVKDITSTSGLIKFNASGNSADSTITAIRIG